MSTVLAEGEDEEDGKREEEEEEVMVKEAFSL
jgi:hypothetical protein